MTDDLAQSVFILTALILPLSALVARRLDWGKAIQMALLWAAIFMIGIAIAGLLAPAQ